MNGAVAAGRAKGRGSKSRSTAPRERRPIAASPAGAAVGPVAVGARSQTPSWFAHLVEMASEHALVLQVGALLLLTAIVYGHTLDVPFYLDDYPSIQENPTVYLWDGSLRAIISQEPLRWITYLSFALNFKLHAFRTTGYHLVNIVIHAANGVLIFFLVKAILQTPAFCQREPSADAPATVRRQAESQWAPFFAAALFVVHPLHIQAVTYIVQRAASLAALFYLLAILSYLRARLADTIASRIRWSAVAVLSMICAFFTKQNTATLPAALVLMELLFWKTDRRKLVWIGVGGILAAFCAWMLFAKALHLDPFSLQSMADITKESKTISRSDYLMTQFRVLWTYLRLFVYPVGLCIDYQGYPIYHKFWQTAVLYSCIGHILMLGFGAWCIRRYPMVAFGIFFYYLAHLVESSVLPITDVVFEHRAYLPDAGIVCLLGWVAGKSYRSQATRLLLRSSSVIVLLVLALLSFQRNEVWRNPLELWGRNVEQQPENQRAWETYGKFLVEAGRYAEAIGAIEKAAIVEKDKDGEIVHRFTQEALLNLIIANYRLNRYERAKQLLESGLAGDPSLLNRAKMLNNYANMMRTQAKYPEAESLYREAIRVYPQGMDARINLSSLLIQTGQLKEARLLLRELDRIDPDNSIVRQQLSILEKLEVSQQ